MTGNETESHVRSLILESLKLEPSYDNYFLSWKPCNPMEGKPEELRISFETSVDVNWDFLRALSKLLGTTNINLDYEEGYYYSELTYGSGSLTIFIKNIGSQL